MRMTCILYKPRREELANGPACVSGLVQFWDCSKFKIEKLFLEILFRNLSLAARFEVLGGVYWKWNLIHFLFSIFYTLTSFATIDM